MYDKAVMGDALEGGWPEGTVDLQTEFDGRYPGAGALLGRVREVADYPSCDVLAVEAGGGREVLVPMIKHIIKNVDVDKKEITLFTEAAKELF